MARVPVEVASSGIEAPVDVRYPSSLGTGRAISSVAEGLGDIASVMQKRQEEDDRFSARIAFEKFKNDLEGDFDNALPLMAPNGQGFHDGFVGQIDPQTGATVKEGAFDARRKELETLLPESQRERYLALADLERGAWSNRAARAENKARMDFFRVSTNDNLDRIAANIAAAPPEDRATFDAYREQGESLIDLTGLPAAEKDELKLKWRASAAEASWNALAAVNPGQARIALGIDPGGEVSARGIIRTFEGFRPEPYWDVNAWRIGYGSDTITRADGTVEKVTPRSRVTREDAERDLARREGEFQQTIIGQIGDEAWKALPPSTQAALTSIAYNYGELPGRVIGAAQSGDPAALAGAIRGLAADNAGINRARREKEAALVEGATGMIDDRYADLPASAVEAGRKRLAMEDTRIRNSIEDDLVSMRQTGQGLDLDPVAVRATLSPAQYAKWETERRAAKMAYDNTHDLAALPMDQIEERIASLKPEPGSADFAVRQSVHDEVAKEAARVEKLRRDDPASAVRSIPEVKAAYDAIQPDKPETIQAAVDASLKAQAAIGIPSYARRAVTVSEAQDLALPIVAAGRMTGRDDISKDESAAVRATVLDIIKNYGPHAQAVLPHVIEQTTKDRQMGPFAAAMFRKLVAGEKVTAQDRQNIEAAADSANASRAMGETPPARQDRGQAPRRGSTAGWEEPWRGKREFPKPNPKHIAALIQNPDLAPAFDEKFGKGASEQYLAAAQEFGGQDGR